MVLLLLPSRSWGRRVVEGPLFGALLYLSLLIPFAKGKRSGGTLRTNFVGPTRGMRASIC